MIFLHLGRRKFEDVLVHVNGLATSYQGGLTIQLSVDEIFHKGFFFTKATGS